MDTPPGSELEQVTAWREQQLLAAGFPADDAITLSRSDCDLHQAVALLKAGCSLEVALVILL